MNCLRLIIFDNTYIKRSPERSEGFGIFIEKILLIFVIFSEGKNPQRIFSFLKKIVTNKSLNSKESYKKRGEKLLKLI